MDAPYKQLEDHFQRLSHVAHALTFLQWDQLVMMPPRGNEARSEAIAELSSIYHDTLTDPALGDLLEKARSHPETAEQSASVSEMDREYRWATCIPTDLVKAKSLAGSKCEHQWRSQRQNNDWAGFLVNFKEVVNLSREEAQARQSCRPDQFFTPYDALLDLYCTGDSSDMISEIFTTLKKNLPPLVSEVVSKQAGRTRLFKGQFIIESQRQLNRKLATLLGFDFEAGRIDESSHPFSTGDVGDHRITSRYRESDFIDALKATAHETGHAAYEGGLPQKWKHKPLGQARNMSIHESQSLLFEKQIFLTKPFLNYFTPTIHAHLEASRDYSCEQIWLNSIKVSPSLIRVEADEVCYPLHVILRYEIESALINGTMEAADLPEVWDDKMQNYLGLSTAGNFRDGCLQDIHWTDGSFGYFPAYTLGALNAAQLFSAFRDQHGDWQEMLSKGDISPILNWLEEHIWSKGRLLDSQELIVKATGEPTNPGYFIDYVKTRYLQESY
ncbi:MAG: carboxypeptidase M32 [Desulfofustis sp.]|nr:carboxypeptidase M32 [Desulfofustis sp.]